MSKISLDTKSTTMTKTPPEDLTDDDLEGLEHLGCSSGTSTPPMVRDAIVRACTEIRRHRVAQIASMERVRGIVRSALTEVIETQWWKVGKLPWMEPEIAEAIAARVASQLRLRHEAARPRHLSSM